MLLQALLPPAHIRPRPNLDIRLALNHNKSMDYPSGTVINMTFYKADQTLTISNATIVNICWRLPSLIKSSSSKYSNPIRQHSPQQNSARQRNSQHPPNHGGHIELALEIPPNDTLDGPTLTLPNNTITIQPYNTTITPAIP